MLSTNTVSKSKTSGVARSRSSQDATALLKADHKLVDNLFKEFEATRSDKKKKELVEKICKELTIHAQVEEEVFYPAVQKALNDHELVPEAYVEHSSLKVLIAGLKGFEPSGDIYDAKVKVLSEYVKHHVKEEEKEMFPEVKASRLNLTELAAKIAERKTQLEVEYK